jgi:hypothetical protein
VGDVLICLTHRVSAHPNLEWLVIGSIRLSVLKRALKVLVIR